MLIHQHRGTQGSNGNVVSIPTPVDFTTGLSPPSNTFSGVIFASNGLVRKLNANGSSTSVGSWLQNGTASTFSIDRTIVSGTLNNDAGGAWILLSTDRRYDILETDQPGIATVTFSISDDGGVSVLDMVSYTFEINP